MQMSIWGTPTWLTCRLDPWQYNDQISEYYVITDDKRFLRASDLTRQSEETDVGDPWLYKNLCFHLGWACTNSFGICVSKYTTATSVDWHTEKMADKCGEST